MYCGKHRNAATCDQSCSKATSNPLRQLLIVKGRVFRPTEVAEQLAICADVAANTFLYDMPCALQIRGICFLDHLGTLRQPSHVLVFVDVEGVHDGFRQRHRRVDCRCTMSWCSLLFPCYHLRGQPLCTRAGGKPLPHHEFGRHGFDLVTLCLRPN